MAAGAARDVSVASIPPAGNDRDALATALTEMAEAGIDHAVVGTT